MKKKNDYTCIIFLNTGRIMRMPYVHNLYKLHIWLIQKNILYDYINVYNRRTRNFIIRINNGDFINPYP